MSENNELNLKLPPTVDEENKLLMSSLFQIATILAQKLLRKAVKKGTI